MRFRQLLFVFAVAAAVSTVVVVENQAASTTEAATDGASMSLSIDGQTGVVEIDFTSSFTVTVSAGSIPLASGYIGVHAWVDFGSTGLIAKKNPQVVWPDCDEENAFVSGSTGDAEHGGCLTALINQPASSYKGPVLSFDATCDSVPGSSHVIRLLSLGHPVALGFGTGYLVDLQTKVTASHSGDFVADEIKVDCLAAQDTDGDGCSDFAEQQTAPGSELTGGLRDFEDPWDFYDVAIAGAVQGQDRQVDLFNDIVSVIDHYAPVGTEPEYDAWYDRGPTAGPNSWNLTPPDGVIDLFNDIVGVINQFGHDCR